MPLRTSSNPIAILREVCVPTRGTRCCSAVRRESGGAQAPEAADPAIERDEVVALLFNVSDIAVAAKTVARYLTGENGGEEEEEDDEG